MLSYLRTMDMIFTHDQLRFVVAAAWKNHRQHKVWAFHAPMGAGKTTFIHALCLELGVVEAVTSPTFAIINEYKGSAQTILHMDWYRLADTEEAEAAGVGAALDSGALCLVEWPEKAPELLPEDTLHIYIEVLDAQTRRIYTSD